MKYLMVGETYWRVSDGMEYKVVHQDSLCFYLCLFRGSCSQIVNVSKRIDNFDKKFVSTYKEALERKVEIAKIKLDNAKEDLVQVKDLV